MDLVTPQHRLVVRLAGLGLLAMSVLFFGAGAALAGKFLPPEVVNRAFGPGASAVMFLELGGACVLLFAATRGILWLWGPRG
jgi:hypothetical protein